MRPRLTLLASLAAFLASCLPSVRAAEPAPLTTGKPVLLFLCFGQSNMGGGGSANQYNQALPDANLPRNDIWYRVSEVTKDTSGWVALGAHPSLGLEVSFAVEMAKAYPQHTIAILKVSRGATPIEYWTPGTPSNFNSRDGYSALDKVIPEVVADLTAKKAAGIIPAFQVAGFAWMQGEANANGIRVGKGRYQAELERLLAFVNDKAGTENIPLVIGRISIQISPASVRDTGGLRVSKSQGGKLPDDADFVNDGQKRGPIWFADQVDRVRTEQEAFCAAYPRAAWVDIDDLTLRDGYHYAPPAYAEMGKRFAAAMRKLVGPAAPATPAS